MAPPVPDRGEAPLERPQACGLRQWTVPEGLDAERADRVVSSLLEVSRSVSKRLIEAGRLIGPHGRKLKPAERVDAGSLLWIGDPPERKIRPEPVEFEVVYEDEHLAVVVKPEGVITHPGAAAPFQTATLAAGLLHRYPQIEGVGLPNRWGIVHRLDRATSGLMVTALSELAYRELGDALRRREVKRLYLALVHGEMETARGAVEAPLGPDPRRRGKRAVVAGGKYALTRYRMVGSRSDPPLSLLEVELETGRTHQIRVHLASIGRPVVGDRLYGGRPDPLGAGRMWLHAFKLDFRHPANPSEQMRHHSPLPPVLGRRVVGMSGV
ncbi:MAG: RluA family pseudouridine synthase [Acidimicrobiia bacterium]|nr:RluA family pseudouridine synthase [Acidimicrobiia bacterium]